MAMLEAYKFKYGSARGINVSQSPNSTPPTLLPAVLVPTCANCTPAPAVLFDVVKTVREGGGGELTTLQLHTAKVYYCVHICICI